MSLDVYLQKRRDELPEAARAVALLRENGFEEFAIELECRHDTSEYETLFSSNITHNLGRMADAAGIGEACWHPEKLGAGVVYAKDITPLLRAGLSKLRHDPQHFEKFNASSGIP